MTLRLAVIRFPDKLFVPLHSSPVMKTNLLLVLCTLAVYFGIALARATGHRSSELNQHMSSCDLPNICSQHGTCETTETGAQCICQDGFRGRRCEHFVSKRCHMYSKQHEGLKTCGAGQWCMPDNFYCHFYPCKNSGGWCLPVQGKVTDSRPTQYDNLLND